MLLPDSVSVYIDAAKNTAQIRQTWLRLLATFPRTSKVKQDLDDAWNRLRFAMDEEWAANWEFYAYVAACEADTKHMPLFDPNEGKPQGD